MTRDETVALFEACEAKRREARAAALAAGKSENEANCVAHETARARWNAWAAPLLAERKTMEVDGRWAAEKAWDGVLLPKNATTQTWLEKAIVNLSNCLFLLQSVEENKETKGAQDKIIILEGSWADFSGFVFPGSANFERTFFAIAARFGDTTFYGSARFEGASFSHYADFERTTFADRATFSNATFAGDAFFRLTAFSGYAALHDTTFSVDAFFSGATFARTADFENANFRNRAEFSGAIFSGETFYESTAFWGFADFGAATFSAHTCFESAVFSGAARFESAVFSHNANFQSAAFNKDVFFEDARFFAPATFSLCDFKRHASFAGAHFGADAGFGAIRGERGFNMAGVRFEVVPDFIQAHFEEAPRLDNLRVGWKLSALKPLSDEARGTLGKLARRHRRWLENRPRYRRLADGLSRESALRNIPARWRALKRLAIQGHDTERELEFHSRELRSQRFTEDWPLPLRPLGGRLWLPVVFWSGRAWAGCFRFWFGYCYQWFSDFGRSLARPAIWASLVLLLAAAFYLGQTEAMQRQLGLEQPGYARATLAAAWAAPVTPVACYRAPPREGSPPEAAGPSPKAGAAADGAGVAPKEAGTGPAPVAAEPLPKPEARAESTGAAPKPEVSGLADAVARETGARAEALHLAFRNASLVLDGWGDASRRIYGCLYGLEGGQYPVVPAVVSSVSAMQKLFAALMIFLFGLALRNMLKMK